MDGYQIVSNLLAEMSVGQVLKHGGKRIGKNFLKDKLATTVTALPIPGTGPITGTAIHLARNKGSRRTAGAMIKKLINPHRAKAAVRQAEKLKKADAAKFRDYLKTTRVLS